MDAGVRSDVECLYWAAAGLWIGRDSRSRRKPRHLFVFLLYNSYIFRWQHSFWVHNFYQRILVLIMMCIQITPLLHSVVEAGFSTKILRQNINWCLWYQNWNYMHWKWGVHYCKSYSCDVCPSTRLLRWLWYLHPQDSVRSRTNFSLTPFYIILQNSRCCFGLVWNLLKRQTSKIQKMP